MPRETNKYLEFRLVESDSEGGLPADATCVSVARLPMESLIDVLHCFGTTQEFKLPLFFARQDAGGSIVASSEPLDIYLDITISNRVQPRKIALRKSNSEMKLSNSTDKTIDVLESLNQDFSGANILRVVPNFNWNEDAEAPLINMQIINPVDIEQEHIQESTRESAVEISVQLRALANLPALQTDINTDLFIYCVCNIVTKEVINEYFSIKCLNSYLIYISLILFVSYVDLQYMSVSSHGSSSMLMR